ncbi:HlyD family secretion protein [Proteiniphilum acetatigenes]|uniref:HlyD family secretion protein n=1 Tax=Proteiniphilum acetatigenes TaxID=294710 RepID=UPI00146C198B|nr:HlyD family efflux transporter periplasmic adaptor subunit [Proteiniphilum acetatigenes]
MEKEEDKIELRSEEFQEVLGTVPPWILQWGITFLAIVVVILLIGSAMFKYPDVISAQVTITGTTPPASVVAHASGKIKELYVKDNQEVKSGDYLAVIDNTANTNDVRLLKESLRAFSAISTGGDPEKNTSGLQHTNHLNKELQLGNIQSIYSQYYTAHFQYNEYKRLLYYPQKLEITKQRIAQYEKQYENLQKQYKLIEEQAQLQENQYQRDVRLNEKGIVSDEELEQSRSQYLQSELTLESMQAAINSMGIQIEQLKETLLDTRQQDTETLNDLDTRLRTLATQLEVAIEEWEMSFVLKSPIDGKVTFTSFWSENQVVTAGYEVFSVVSSLSPSSSYFIFGKALLPIARSGKVKIGQKVNIRLENFPENEFGILQGQVKNISLVPISAGQAAAENGAAYYTIDIILPDRLTTTYKKELPYLPHMQGRADIITEDISLLERFFLPMKRILSESL